jgi:riboflavin kinase / FMN adenylyltransferase
MDILNASLPLPEALRHNVLALGNFDGFHAGHQAVVARARAMAGGERPLIVASFDPHPVRFFAPEAAPFRLTSLAQRAALFAQAGASHMLVFPFNAALAQVTAQAFIEEWLLARAGASGIVTGEDFTFGAKRTGSVQTLRDYAHTHALQVEAVAPVCDAGGIISSSRIREYVQAGEPQAAAALLTRPFAIEGIVIAGAQLGRTLGYPTANILLGDYIRPRYGIYAVRARLADGRCINGAANIGIRPSFAPPQELLEVFLFDFNEDLYGQTLQVELLYYIRPEAKFDTLAALQSAMEQDCILAHKALSNSA